MSAYVVDVETINGALSFLNQAQHRQAMDAASTLKAAGYPVDDTTRLAALGGAMYALNIDAVGQRYSDCKTAGDVPGIIGPKVYGFKLSHYVNREHNGRTARIPITIYQALKSLRCWAYQCSEGDIGERPLFKTMGTVIHDLQGAIIDGLPEYESAKWG